MNFFCAQALGIATKINKGSIELVSEVHLIKTGDKVGASQATLLGKLGVKPFKYGLQLLKVRWAVCSSGLPRWDLHRAHQCSVLSSSMRLDPIGCMGQRGE